MPLAFQGKFYRSMFYLQHDPFVRFKQLFRSKLINWYTLLIIFSERSILHSIPTPTLQTRFCVKALKLTSEGVHVNLPAFFDPLNISKRFWKKVGFKLKGREMMRSSTHKFDLSSLREGTGNFDLPCLWEGLGIKWNVAVPSKNVCHQQCVFCMFASLESKHLKFLKTHSYISIYKLAALSYKFFQSCFVIEIL